MKARAHVGMRRFTFLCSVPFALCSAVQAQNPRVAQALELVKVWLDAQRSYQQIPGLSAAIIRDQELVWSGGFGFTDLEKKTPASASTIYSICSISKLFTGVAVLQLRDEGKLRLDDPVARHLPWFTALKRTKPEAGEITIEGILTHASGLPRESDHPYWTGPNFPFPTREQIIAGLSKQEALYPAETYWQYSNLGITLAGEIVIAASGRTYADYVQEKILGPLGMTSTTPEMPEAEQGKRLATGYSALTRSGTRTKMPFYLARGIAPAAGYASTVEDLGRFASWQFKTLSGGSQNILKLSTLREMHRVHWVDPEFETTWGLGFAVWRVGGKSYVGHGGSCPGYRSQLVLRPEDKIAVAVAANAMVDAGGMAQDVYAIMAPSLTGKAPDKPDPDFSAYLGTYTAQPWSGESAIVAWEDGIAELSLPTNDPVNGLTKLRKTGEHTFRRVRKDGELGETVTFEVGSDGRATALVWYVNRRTRIR
jgi:CubicO group peptidase (beta-lactamase class C family)